MKTHYICQNTMTGAIHILYRNPQENIPIFSYNQTRLTPCGYRIVDYEIQYNPNLTKKSKVCIKCHNFLLKTHSKNLMAYMAYIKLTGEIDGRFKI